jgi:5-methylcytosine-specific restriction endonuclease McrA
MDFDYHRRSVLDQSALVINRSWIPVHVTTVRRAVIMVYQDIAAVVAADTLQVHDFEHWVSLPEPGVTRWIRGAGYVIPAPEVIQLRIYDRVPAHEAPFTRKNLYHRDRFTCQYCGRRGNADRMSIDHVLPKSKGGRTSWENCVLACVRCNARKADRTLHEAGLRLQRKPSRPRWSPYLSLAGGDRLPSWRRFTPDEVWEATEFGHATGS